jgi:hypothetical protein
MSQYNEVLHKIQIGSGAHPNPYPFLVFLFYSPSVCNKEFASGIIATCDAGVSPHSAAESSAYVTACWYMYLALNARESNVITGP